MNSNIVSKDANNSNQSLHFEIHNNVNCILNERFIDNDVIALIVVKVYQCKQYDVTEGVNKVLLRLEIVSVLYFKVPIATSKIAKQMTLKEGLLCFFRQTLLFELNL